MTQLIIEPLDQISILEPTFALPDRLCEQLLHSLEENLSTSSIDTIPLYPVTFSGKQPSSRSRSSISTTVPSDYAGQLLVDEV